MELLSILPLLAFVLMCFYVARNRPKLHTWAKVLLAVVVLVVVANLVLSIIVDA